MSGRRGRSAWVRQVARRPNSGPKQWFVHSSEVTPVASRAASTAQLANVLLVGAASLAKFLVQSLALGSCVLVHSSEDRLLAAALFHRSTAPDAPETHF